MRKEGRKREREIREIRVIRVMVWYGGQYYSFGSVVK